MRRAIKAASAPAAVPPFRGKKPGLGGVIVMGCLSGEQQRERAKAAQ